MPATNQREALLQTIERKPHLNDRFELIQRIDPNGGGGQFSLVLRARDRHGDRDVALKFFDPSQRGDVYRWESFKRETELLPQFQGKPDILQCLCPLTEFKEPFENQLGIVFNVDFAFYAELAKCDDHSLADGLEKPVIAGFRKGNRLIVRVPRWFWHASQEGLH